MLQRRFPERRRETLLQSVRFLCKEEQLVHWAGVSSFSNTVFEFKDKQQFKFKLQQRIIAQGEWSLDENHSLSLNAKDATNQMVLWPAEKEEMVYLQSDGLRLYLRTSHEFVCFARSLHHTKRVEEMPLEEFYVLMRAILSLPMEEAWLLLLGWLEYWIHSPQFDKALEYLTPHLDSWPSEKRVLPWHYLYLAYKQNPQHRWPLMRLARSLHFQQNHEFGLHTLGELEGLEEIRKVQLTVVLSKDIRLLGTLGEALWSDSIRHLTLHSEHETGDQLLDYLEEFEVFDVWLPNLLTLSVKGSIPPTSEALNKWSKAEFLSSSVQRFFSDLAAEL